jgi:Zn finger protein HypA/HybF involved in hydrogenase expression
MKPIKFFIKSSGGILLAAALERFLAGSGHAPVLATPDSMLGLPLRYVMLLVGGFELLVALICLFGRRPGFQLGWLVWASTNHLVYWIGLFIMQFHPQTTCIGSLTDPLQLGRGTPGNIIGLLPFYLWLGSCAAAIWLWIGKALITRLSAIRPLKPIVAEPSPAARRPAVLVRTLKISCTACGGRIEFPTNFFGERIPCPHCQTTITLQKARSLKIACTACDGHLEFPDHALGQMIPCPHCKTNITLKEPA